jgi:hypothetical protein
LASASVAQWIERSPPKIWALACESRLLNRVKFGETSVQPRLFVAMPSQVPAVLGKGVETKRLGPERMQPYAGCVRWSRHSPDHEHPFGWRRKSKWDEGIGRRSDSCRGHHFWKPRRALGRPATFFDAQRRRRLSSSASLTSIPSRSAVANRSARRTPGRRTPSSTSISLTSTSTRARYCS